MSFSLLRNILSSSTSRQIPSTLRGTNSALLPSVHYLSSNTLHQSNHDHHQQSQRFHHSATASSRQMRTSTSFSTQRLPTSKETLQISEKAKKRLNDILEEDSFLRVVVDSGGCSGFQYKFEIDKKLDEDDVEIHYSVSDDPKGKTILAIDPTSLDILRGSTLDYEMELIRSAFRIVDNPQAEQGCSCGASFNVKID